MKMQLHITPPGGSPYAFEHPGPEVRIGRDPEGELAFAGAAQDNVSWNHAKITLSNRAATLTDLNSTNGTFLNGNPIKAGALRIGDVLRLGQTGPTLKVLALETAGAQGPPVYAAPPARVRQNGESPRIAPQPPISATRKLLIETQGRHRNLIATLAGIFLLLLFLVATTVWVLQRRADRALATGENNQNRLGVVEKSQDKTKRDVVDLAAGQAEHEKKLAEHAQRLNEAEGAVKELKAADLDLVKRIAENEREFDRRQQQALAEAKRLDEAAAGKPAIPGQAPVRNLAEVNRARGGNARAGAELEFIPGMKLTIRLRNSANQIDYENISLIRATEDSLIIQSLEPKTFRFDQIDTIYYERGAYSFNPNTKAFEYSLAHYVFDSSSNGFVKTAGPPSGSIPSIEQIGILVGEDKIQCLIGKDNAGKMMLTLPGSRIGSDFIMATTFRTIATRQGVYEFHEATHEYKFTDHVAIAKMIAEERAKKEEAFRDKMWQRRKEAYSLVTSRIRALRPYWWRWF